MSNEFQQIIIDEWRNKTMCKLKTTIATKKQLLDPMIQ